MRVLLTGGTGYLGARVGAALAEAGHDLVALAHHEQAAEAIRACGWTAAPGDLTDLSRLAELAADAEAVVHAGKAHGPGAGDIDQAAARTFLSALERSGKPFVYTSGIFVLGPGESRENDPLDEPAAASAWRADLEPEILAAAERGVRSVVIRPGMIYGEGGGIPGQLGRGELPVVGDGSQRWPLVHRADIAVLYRLALAAPGGSALHGVAEHRPMIDVARRAMADRGRRGEPQRLPLDEARERLGALADALALDQQVDSRHTRRLTGWEPTRTLDEHGTN